MALNFYTLVVDGWRYRVEVMDCTHLRWLAIGSTAGFNFTPLPWCIPQHVGQLSYLWETALKSAGIMSSNGALFHYSETYKPSRSVAA